MSSLEGIFPHSMMAPCARSTAGTLTVTASHTASLRYVRPSRRVVSCWPGQRMVERGWISPTGCEKLDAKTCMRTRYDLKSGCVASAVCLISGGIPLSKIGVRTTNASAENLIPFTHWMTPPHMPKRFSTQMYLYLLPVSQSIAHETVVPVPTHDGGLEHTAATFDDASAWLAKARAGEIFLFPPQCYLLTLLSGFFRGAPPPDVNASTWYLSQRDKLTEFLKAVPTSQRCAHPTAQIPWAEKVMSPTSLFVRKSDGRVVLGLDKPGSELAGTDHGGDWDRVVLVKFRKTGPTEVEVRWREDVVREERGAAGEGEANRRVEGIGGRGNSKL